jgi:quercetin dioxygenase-like cupin family protein
LGIGARSDLRKVAKRGSYGVKAGLKMSQLYYESAEGWSYAVSMKSRVFVVQRDVDRWGKRIDCSVSPFVKVSSQDTGGAWSVFEGAIAPGFGPPLHLHYCQEEWFQVKEGDFIFEADGAQYALKPGESILIPRMIAHRFQNTGTSTGQVLILAQPSGTLEQFFEEFLALSLSELGGGSKLTELFARHGMEVLGPPLPVRGGH